MKKCTGIVLASMPALLAAAALAAPAASDGLERIAIYAGTWHTQAEHYTTPYSKAGKETGVLRNDCWRSRAFYACEQVVDGQSKALIVFQRGKDDSHYVTHPLPADGGAAGNGTLQIDGDRWTFPWQFSDHGKTVYARVVNVFHGRDRIDYRQEYSFDQVHWMPMAKGTETRQP